MAGAPRPIRFGLLDLTEKQDAILRGMIAGKPKKQIMAETSISEYAFNTIRSGLYWKFGARNTAAFMYGVGRMATVDDQLARVTEEITMECKQLSPIDMHIADRVKVRRKQLHIPQETVAAALGLTFQQFQKYENKKNRIPAGRLLEIANALRTDVAHFYEGAPAISARPPRSQPTAAASRRTALSTPAQQLPS